LKMLGIWFIPVILIPLIWPAYSIWVGHFDEWLNGVLWQGTGRQASILSGIESHRILGSIVIIFNMDPILTGLSLAGVIFATIKRNFFLLLWIMPFLIFIYLIGWVTYFHYILVLPVFCIACATLIEDLSNRISKKRIHQTLLTFIVISGIGIFGLVSTIILITTNFSSSLFEAAAFVAQNLQGNSHAAGKNSNNNNNDDVTIISSPIYSWIFKYVFDKTHVFSHIRDSSQSIKTKKVLLIADEVYKGILSQKSGEDRKQIERIQRVYNNTKTIAIFGTNENYYNYNKRHYPYTSMILHSWAGEIKIKANY
jgi:hypothetical protein